MARDKTTSGSAELKALIGADRELLRGLVRETLQ